MIKSSVLFLLVTCFAAQSNGQDTTKIDYYFGPVFSAKLIAPNQVQSTVEYLSYTNLSGVDLNLSFSNKIIVKNIIIELAAGTSFTKTSQQMTFSNPVDINISNVYNHKIFLWNLKSGIGYHFGRSKQALDLSVGIQYTGLYTKWIPSQPLQGSFTSSNSTGQNFYENQLNQYQYEVTYFGNNFFTPYVDLSFKQRIGQGNIVYGVSFQSIGLGFETRTLITSDTHKSFGDTEYKSISLGIHLGYEFGNE